MMVLLLALDGASSLVPRREPRACKRVRPVRNTRITVCTERLLVQSSPLNVELDLLVHLREAATVGGRELERERTFHTVRSERKDRNGNEWE